MITKILELKEKLNMSDSQMLGAFNDKALNEAYEQMQYWEIANILKEYFSADVTQIRENAFKICKGYPNVVEVTTKRILASNLLNEAKGNLMVNEIAEDKLLDFIEDDSELGEWKKINDTYYYRRVDG